MDTVVAIHNNMNENTWAQLLAWEKLHPVRVSLCLPVAKHWLTVLYSLCHFFTHYLFCCILVVISFTLYAILLTVIACLHLSS